jgi:predicted Ser/Thr protein kinase
VTTNPTKIGRYEIIERVGRGGMGAVYRGRDTVLDREVAIKVMSADFAADETSRPRFYREARAAAKLQHRNIVTIFEFGEEDETPFIVMEFLRGQDLNRRMRAEPPLTLEEKLDIVAELCTGLHFAHEQGVIHRDVKPANIWLVPDGSIKLLDFGIAKFSSSTMTRQGSVFGSISYMSPEQVNGSDVDGRADIFSAGVVLYELLSGKKPFAGDSPTAVLARIMDDEPASLADLPSDLPKPLVAAVARALEKNREKRYRHAADLGADLRLVRTALVAVTEPVGAGVDIAETMLTDTNSNKLLNSGAHELAGSVTVSRTASLELRESGQIAAARRRGWVVGIALAVVVLAAATALFVFRGSARTASPGAASATAAGAGTPAARGAPTRVLVKILSEPPGANIALNDTETGRVTPAEVEVDTSRPLPKVKLSRAGREPITARLNPDDVRAGSLLLRFPGDDKPAPAVSQTPVPESRTRVTMSGDYPFEVLDGNRVISATAQSHEFTVPGHPRLRIRNQEYFLDQPVQVDGSRPVFEWQAPGLGTLRLIAGETCNVAIANVKLGEPPIQQTMAAGNYTAQVTCAGQTRPWPFTIHAGTQTNVTARW